MQLKHTTFAALLAAVTLLASPGPVMAQGPEDEVPKSDLDAPTGTLIEIPAPTVPMVVYDFDLMPGGATTVGDIQAAFPDGGVLDITTTPRNNGNGVYNFQTGGGRALTADPAGGGGLWLVDPPSGAFDEVNDITFTFAAPMTEFGFEIGDWAGPFNIECFLGAASVGTVQVSTVGDDREHFVQDAGGFDSCLLTALPDNPPANWVVPSIQTEEGIMVPTVSSAALALLALLVLASGFLVLRRRQLV